MWEGSQRPDRGAKTAPTFKRCYVFRVRSPCSISFQNSPALPS